MKAGSYLKKAAALFFVVILLSGLSVFAEGIDDEINQTKTEMDQEQQFLMSTEERIAALEASKNSSEEYLTELSKQLDELNNELISINTKLEEKEQELAQNQSDLEAIRKLADEQYEDMKIRIQFLYETGASAGLFESLFSAESFTEFLNRAENYSELNRYDRQMLSDYEMTLQEIKDHENDLLAEKEEILSIQKELYSKRSRLQELYQAVYLDMTEYIQALDDSKAEQSALIEELSFQADRMNELLKQQYEEEAERLREEQKRAEEEALRAAREAETLLEAQEDTYEGSDDPAVDYVEPSIPNEETPNADETAPSEEPGHPEDSSDSDGSSEAETADEQSTDSTDQENGNPEADDPDENGEDPEETDSEDKDSAGSDMTYLGNFTLTAYCPCAQCCGAYASGHTASGTVATEGVTVAMGGVDFGTKLCINGHIYTVEDRGTAYGHVDIFFSSHEDAVAFGMQYADVYQVN